MHSSADLFRKALADRLQAAQAAGSGFIQLSWDLHHDVSGASGVNQTPNCCQVMRKAMQDRDEILPRGPPSGHGANLTIMYRFPRRTSDAQRT